MAYISSFIYCDSIQIQMTPNGPQNQIVNPLQVLTPVAIPGNYSFTISCSISGFQKSSDHKVELIFSDPSGGEVAKPVEFSINIERDICVDELHENSVPGITLNVDLRNVILKSEGIYSTKVLLDEELIGEYKIQVVKAK